MSEYRFLWAFQYGLPVTAPLVVDAKWTGCQQNHARYVVLSTPLVIPQVRPTINNAPSSELPERFQND